MVHKGISQSGGKRTQVGRPTECWAKHQQIENSDLSWFLEERDPPPPDTHTL